MEKELEQTEAKKMVLGEKIEFDRVLKTRVETQYGLTTIVKFAKNGKIVRSIFAGNGLLDFLDQNPQAKSVKFVDKIVDGKYTYNVYE